MTSAEVMTGQDLLLLLLLIHIVVVFVVICIGRVSCDLVALQLLLLRLLLMLPSSSTVQFRERRLISDTISDRSCLISALSLTDGANVVPCLRRTAYLANLQCYDSRFCSACIGFNGPVFYMWNVIHSSWVTDTLLRQALFIKQTQFRSR